MGPGEVMANTPIEFLIEESDISLTYLYLGEGLRIRFPRNRFATQYVTSLAQTRRRQVRPVRVPCKRIRGPSLVLSAVLQSFRPSLSLLCSQALTELSWVVGVQTPQRRRCEPIDKDHDALIQAHACRVGKFSLATIRNHTNSAKTRREELGECARWLQRPTKSSNSKPMILVQTKPMVTKIASWPFQ